MYSLIVHPPLSPFSPRRRRPIVAARSLLLSLPGFSPPSYAIVPSDIAARRENNSRDRAMTRKRRTEKLSRRYARRTSERASDALRHLRSRSLGSRPALVPRALIHAPRTFDLRGLDGIP